MVVGAPAGKTKTILTELTGKLPSGSGRLRVSSAFEVHWDRIALFDRRDSNETRVVTVAATKSDLHWRGYSEFEPSPWTQPLTPVYDRVSNFDRLIVCSKEHQVFGHFDGHVVDESGCRFEIEHIFGWAEEVHRRW